MISFVGRLEVPLDPSEVFDRLADMAELHRWNPNVKASRRLSGDRLEVGSTYQSTIVRGPIRMNALSTLKQVAPGSMVRYEGTIAGFSSADWLTFEANENGTLITFRNESIPPRWLRPLTRVLNAAFQGQARAAVAGAKDYLSESGLGDAIP